MISTILRMTTILGIAMIVAFAVGCTVGTPCTTTAALHRSWSTSIGERYQKLLIGGTLTEAETAAVADLVREANDFGALLDAASKGCAGGQP